MSTDLATFTAAPLEQRMRYAETLAAAGDLIPRGLRDNRGMPVPGKILLVAETGSMLGMHPIAALQGVNIIDGKPTISPALMSAVVRRAGHKLRVVTRGSVKQNTFEATATLIRADDPDHPFTATWNLERAQRAGLAGKGAWGKYFEAMCKARSISEVCREGAEDALMGVGYVPEELGADVDESGNVVESVEAPAASAAAPDAFPPLAECVPAEPVRDWIAEGTEARSMRELAAVDAALLAAKQGGLKAPDGRLVRDHLRDMKPRFMPPHFITRGRAATTKAELSLVIDDAVAAEMPPEVVQQIGSFEESLPVEAEEVVVAEVVDEPEPIAAMHGEPTIYEAGEGEAAWAGDRG